MSETSTLISCTSPSFRVIATPVRGRAENSKPGAAIRPIGNATGVVTNAPSGHSIEKFR